MRKIIFLDIDGVVNSHDWWHRRGKLDEGHSYDDFQKHEFDPAAVARLKKLIEETDAEVVLSSVWRLGEKNQEAVRKYAVDFIGVTGQCTSRIRGAEIHMWIQDNIPHTERDQLRYAIIDDDSDMLLWQKDNFFQTKTEMGLTDEICYKIKEHLLCK